jgi:hypothetical protein
MIAMGLYTGLNCLEDFMQDKLALQKFLELEGSRMVIVTMEVVMVPVYLLENGTRGFWFCSFFSHSHNQMASFIASDSRLLKSSITFEVYFHWQ